MNDRDREEIDKWREERSFNNFVRRKHFESGFYYIVMLKSETEYRDNIRETFTWLHKNSTAKWSKFLVGIFAFESEADAVAFKIMFDE